MMALLLPDAEELREHPELGALAALAVSLALARNALADVYPEVHDPLCPRLFAADLMLHHLAGLDQALAHYRDVLAGNDSLPIPRV